jgi:hypothetical protein
MMKDAKALPERTDEGGTGEESVYLDSALD